MVSNTAFTEDEAPTKPAEHVPMMILIAASRIERLAQTSIEHLARLKFAPVGQISSEIDEIIAELVTLQDVARGLVQ
jgi:hypothetical protein